jgi:hypothetical protein
MRARTSSVARMALLALTFMASGRALCADRPDGAMMDPITRLAEFMASPNAPHVPAVFAARGVVILENFPPYLFTGPNAAKRWESEFRAHVQGELANLVVRFGEPHDFSRYGDRIYVVLPTTWSGRYRGKNFEESGAWSFVLEKEPAGWRIVAYAWGVTDLQLQTPPRRDENDR